MTHPEIPDAAVIAALEGYFGPNWRAVGSLRADKMRRALAAALPLLGKHMNEIEVAQRKLYDQNAALLDVVRRAHEYQSKMTSKSADKLDAALASPIVQRLLARPVAKSEPAVTDEPKRGKCRIAGGEPGAER